jgi:hypothetical protein
MSTCSLHEPLLLEETLAIMLSDELVFADDDPAAA